MIPKYDAKNIVNSDDREMLNFPVVAVIVAIAYFGLSSAGLYFGWKPGNAATLWYSNAVAIIALLYIERKNWPMMLAIIAVSNIAASIVSGGAALFSLRFLPGNTLEILTAAWFIERKGLRLAALSSTSSFIRTLLWGALVPTLLGAGTGAIMVAIDQPLPLARYWLTWFEGDLLGVISIVPFGLVLLKRGLRDVVRSLTKPCAVIGIVSCVVVALVVPFILPFPFAYIALPLIVVAVRSGITATSFAVLLMSVVLGLLFALRIILVPPPTLPGGDMLYSLPILATLVPPMILATAIEEIRATNRRLSEAQARFRKLYRSSPSMMHSHGPDLAIADVSQFWLDKMGYKEAEVVGHPIDQFMAPGSAKLVDDIILAAIERQSCCSNIELQMVTRAGDILDVYMSAVVEHDVAGAPQSILVATTDVTERKRLARSLAAEQEFLEITLHSIGDGVVSTDAAGRIQYLNPIAEEMLGWSHADARGRPFDDVVQLHDQASDLRLISPVRLCLAEGRRLGLPHDAVLRDRKGVDHPIQDVTSPIRGHEGEIAGAVMVFQDVGETRALMQRMSHLVQHDALTNLPNRILLYDRVHHACQVADRDDGMFGLAFLDLDNFKFVNDSLGHAAGDDLLRIIAQRLSAALSATDTACRVGGDEFVILVDKLETLGGMIRVAENILAEIARPVLLGDIELNITGSLGLALFPDHGGDVETLMKHADAALYRAKRDGKNLYRFFSVSGDEATLKRLSIEADMRRGLGRGHFHVHYQPVIDSATGIARSVEALARWNRNGADPQSPSLFIPLAEESGLIIPLNSWVLGEACRQMREWIDAEVPIERIAVNISAVQFGSTGFVASVIRTLKENGLRGDQLELEITESTLLKQPRVARAVLDELRSLGLKIAIDDFGTGFSSLSYLRTLPVDTLKVDKSFIDGIVDSIEDRKIVEAIVHLGRSLNLHVVAEGVETEAQARLLRAMSCDALQGYLFARPMEGAAIPERLSADGGV
jgi:diguanylate cyclase (GGDEF)-like protein/PAS domain S-box-containing protein